MTAAASVFLQSIATWLPPLQRVEHAVAAGECEERLAASMDIESVAVSTGPSGPEMAALAACKAVDRAELCASDVALVLHTCSYYQGMDMWSTASYVQRESLYREGPPEVPPAPAMEIRQVSNGGMAALAIARAWLAGSGPARPSVLISTGDRFCEPGFQRWRTDPGTVYGDGGTAAVVSSRGGFARIRGLALSGAPELEGWHREGHGFSRVQTEQEQVVDLASRQRRFLSSFGRSRAIARVAAGQRAAIDGALAEAGVGWDDISWFVLPAHGRRRREVSYLDPMGISPGSTAWDHARTVGHLGAGDVFCGLEHLMRAERAAPGDLVMLLGVGAGFSWSAAVLEMQEILPGGEAAYGGRYPGA